MWFSLSDEGVEDAIYDSYEMRRSMGLDFALEQVPDATTLLAFRHLLEEPLDPSSSGSGCSHDWTRFGGSPAGGLGGVPPHLTAERDTGL